ncbi:helicase associated domain-containing protein [Streptomyces sp. NPDC089799]|uniref:helicase associated domain-containing protein n=1 Tax=Streptomyces sp. NPDC089799 TaxID=3155066 RepID=UPI00342423C4
MTRLLTSVAAGVTRHGDDVGRWLASQRRDWARLNAEQQTRLTELGVKPARAVQARQAPGKASTATGTGRGAAAFQTGLRALAQYVAEHGALPGRSAVQALPDGTEQRVGIWYANQKQRRHRLDPHQLEALAELGVDWAAGSAV